MSHCLMTSLNDYFWYVSSNTTNEHAIRDSMSKIKGVRKEFQTQDKISDSLIRCARICFLNPRPNKKNTCVQGNPTLPKFTGET